MENADKDLTQVKVTLPRRVGLECARLDMIGLPYKKAYESALAMIKAIP